MVQYFRIKLHATCCLLHTFSGIVVSVVHHRVFVITDSGSDRAIVN